ncbi:MAG: hypothetical protein IJZ39_08610 [Oscillospiraceae bacterium]|nr:hypothetical protein [Oscillospiraceae bacterium]
MSIHDGHRQRLKNQFVNNGLDGFTEVQMLEILLFYVIPRRDTNPIAHALINRFGSLSNVLDAPMAKLIRDGKLTENAAVFLKLVKAAGRCYESDKSRQKKILSSVSECGEYLKPFFINRKNEVVYLLSLDAKLKVLNCRQVGEGSVNYASVPIRRVVEMALEDGASTVVLAHNHPSGLAIPSADDIQATRRLAAALSAVEIVLADHIVVAEDENEEDRLDYVSMRQSNIRFDDCLIY